MHEWESLVKSTVLHGLLSFFLFVFKRAWLCTTKAHWFFLVLIFAAYIIFEVMEITKMKEVEECVIEWRLFLQSTDEALRVLGFLFHGKRCYVYECTYSGLLHKTHFLWKWTFTVKRGKSGGNAIRQSFILEVSMMIYNLGKRQFCSLFWGSHYLTKLPPVFQKCNWRRVSLREKQRRRHSK